jgi:tetratricopeptide (TPR) repeat protein
MHPTTLKLLAPALLIGVLALSGCKQHAWGGRPLEGAETEADIALKRRKSLSLTEEGQRFERAGRYTQAEMKYREAIETYREMPPAWNSLGQMLDRKGDKLAAAEAFKTASELEPRDPVALTNLGVLWESIGYIEDAKRWYEEALKRDENHLPALRRLLVVEKARNHPDALTLEHIRRALLIERDPWWSEQFQRMRNQFEQMLADYKTDAMSRPDLMVRPGAGPPTPTPPPTPAPGADAPNSVPPSPVAPPPAPPITEPPK